MRSALDPQSNGPRLARGRRSRLPSATLHERLRDLVEEPARRVVLGRTAQRSAPRVGEVEPVHGAGDADVGEPALLLELERVRRGSEVREHAVLQADQEHVGELEALGRVQRHEHDGGLVLVLGDVIGVGDEADLLEEPGDVVELAGPRPTSSARFSSRPSASMVCSAWSSVGVAGPLEDRLEHGGRPGRHQLGEPVDQRQERLDAARRLGPTTPAAGARRSASMNGMPWPPGHGVEPPDGGVADAALGHVEDPLEADLVDRVDDRLDVGERVLDLAPVVEAGAADDLVGDARRA